VGSVALGRPDPCSTRRNLHRYLSFGERGDLHDIIAMDWPSVKRDLQAAM
jgi:hypothetical protein